MTGRSQRRDYRPLVAKALSAASMASGIILLRPAEDAFGVGAALLVAVAAGWAAVGMFNIGAKIERENNV